MQQRKHTRSNLSQKQVAETLKIGFILEGDPRNPKIVSIRKLHRMTGSSRKCCQLWWSRRDEFIATGSIKRKPYPSPNRKTHSSFNTASKINDAIKICEDLKDGHHQKHAANQLNCSISTLYRHTTKRVTWRIPPRRNVGFDNKLKKKRTAYSKYLLNKNGRLKSKYKNPTFIDHTMVSFYGGNKTHFRQCRRRGSKKKLRAMPKSMHNPKIHCMGVANKKGVGIYRHAKKYKIKKGKYKGR